MPPGTTCSPTSKDTTIVSGSILPSGISPPNRQSAKTLNPVSTKSQEGHILIFDGSHGVFTNSDVTVLFFEVLRRLKPGVLVHLHDVFLPEDYPVVFNDRLYSELHAARKRYFSRRLLSIR